MDSKIPDNTPTPAPWRPKLSEQVATRIIDLIRTRRLPQGHLLWTEAEALHTLGVSRGTFREAVRQLEWQGVVTMHRGIGGGLRTSRPRAYVPLFTIKRYFEIAGVDTRTLRRSFRLLQTAMDFPGSRDGNEVLRLLAGTADGLFTAALGNGPSTASRAISLAERTAWHIAMEIDDKNLGPGASIGSEATLVRKVGVGRGVLREALRLLELNRIIEVRRGMHGGVFVRRPSPEFAIYVCCVYLALAHIPVRSIVAAQTGICSALTGADAESLPITSGAQETTPDTLKALAVDGIRRARAANLHAIEVFMMVFRRFWDEFCPDPAGLPLPTGKMASPVPAPDSAPDTATQTKLLDKTG